MSECLIFHSAVNEKHLFVCKADFREKTGQETGVCYAKIGKV